MGCWVFKRDVDVKEADIAAVGGKAMILLLIVLRALRKKRYSS